MGRPQLSKYGTPLRGSLPLAASRPHLPAMPFPIMPDPVADRARERHDERWHPERETLELATAGAAKVLGHDTLVVESVGRLGGTEHRSYDVSPSAKATHGRI